MTQPANLRTLDLPTCIDLLVLIDQRTGFQLDFPSQDPIAIDREMWRGNEKYAEIQRVAKTLASSIGLDGYRFIVSVARQKNSVAAHIELDRRGTDVFIELDPDIIDYPEATLAVLAHELSHKWLHQRQIRLDDPTENEILTDIASVFLGFGKYCLNGCVCTSSSTSSAIGRTVTTHSVLTTGYICRQSFARAYLLMARRQGTPPSQLHRGLSTPARDELLSTPSKFPNVDGRNDSASLSRENDLLRDRIAEHKRQIAAAEHQLRLLERSSHGLSKKAPGSQAVTER
jgi:hypothetical protein